MEGALDTEDWLLEQLRWTGNNVCQRYDLLVAVIDKLDNGFVIVCPDDRGSVPDVVHGVLADDHLALRRRVRRWGGEST